MPVSEYTCPNGCDLRGEPIPQEYIDAGYYGTKTHYSRMIGIENPRVYDGVIAWHCPDCGLTWPRPGFEWAFEGVRV